MPKDKPVHFRILSGIEDLKRIACNYKLTGHAFWTADKKDVTCDNCRNTKAFKALLRGA